MIDKGKLKLFKEGALDNPYMVASVMVNEYHKNQYGSQPYSTHILEVVNLLRKWRYPENTIVAGALHDIVEDTEVDITEIMEIFGGSIAEMVWACTGIGDNRKERNNNIKEKLIWCPDAIPIKLADRIANVRNCILNNDSRLSMYMDEMDDFMELKKYRKSPLWDELDKLVAGL